MGLAPISQPVRQGTRYVLRAVDRRGVEVTVAADALSGRILFVHPSGYGGGPVYAERSYPRADPEGFVPSPRGYEEPRSYEQRRSYEQQGNYEQRGNYDRQSPRNPPEPSVIYAPRDNANAPPPQPPARAAKPPAPKVAAKPAAKPAAAVEAAASRQQSDAATDVTTGATASQPPEENPAPAIPPVQSLE